MRKRTRGRNIVVMSSLVLALAGCASYPLAPTRSAPSTVDMTVGRQSGAIFLSFNTGYQTSATGDDVKHLSITVSGTGISPINQNLAWPSITQATFSGLAAGTYKVQIDALDQYYNAVGTVTQDNVAVQAGQTTPVALRLILAGGGSGSPGGISLDVTIEDGTSPLPTPTPTPLPSPTPQPTTPPTSAGAFSDDFESDFSKWEASWTRSSYSDATFASSAWGASSVSANGGTHGACPGDSEGNVTETGTYTMTLANPVNLSATSRSVLRFDLGRFTAQYYFKTGKFEVEASSDGGVTWTSTFSQTPSQVDWKRIEVDLTSYRSTAVKVRFRYTYDYYLGTDKMTAPCIDNVYLGAY